MNITKDQMYELLAIVKEYAEHVLEEHDCKPKHGYLMALHAQVLSEVLGDAPVRKFGGMGCARDKDGNRI